MTHDSMTLLVTKGVNKEDDTRTTVTHSHMNESAQFWFTQDGQDSTKRFSSTKGILFLHSHCSGMLVSVVARAEETRHRAIMKSQEGLSDPLASQISCSQATPTTHTNTHSAELNTTITCAHVQMEQLKGLLCWRFLSFAQKSQPFSVSWWC
jgi:hypothetical protein